MASTIMFANKDQLLLCSFRKITEKTPVPHGFSALPLLNQDGVLRVIISSILIEILVGDFFCTTQKPKNVWMHGEALQAASDGAPVRQIVSGNICLQVTARKTLAATLNTAPPPTPAFATRFFLRLLLAYCLSHPCMACSMWRTFWCVFFIWLQQLMQPCGLLLDTFHLEEVPFPETSPPPPPGPWSGRMKPFWTPWRGALFGLEWFSLQHALGLYATNATFKARLLGRSHSEPKDHVGRNLG